MFDFSLEATLVVAYSVFLALVAMFLEMAARHAHRRSVNSAHAGFTYHRERDVWRCPTDQYLFPIFSDPVKGTAVYRAPAATCNACPSKGACTDSDHGRQIETRTLAGVQFGMQRFQRVFSLTLLLLACLLLCIETIRAHDAHTRGLVELTLILLLGSTMRVFMSLQRRESALTNTSER